MTAPALLATVAAHATQDRQPERRPTLPESRGTGRPDRRRVGARARHRRPLAQRLADEPRTAHAREAPGRPRAAPRRAGAHRRSGQGGSIISCASATSPSRSALTSTRRASSDSCERSTHADAPADRPCLRGRRARRHAGLLRRPRRRGPPTRTRPRRWPPLPLPQQATPPRQGPLVRWVRLVRPQQATGARFLSAAPASRFRRQGPSRWCTTFASLLAGIDFTAARRGWYRRERRALPSGGSTASV
jgi:hypothetical protein